MSDRRSAVTLLFDGETPPPPPSFNGHDVLDHLRYLHGDVGVLVLIGYPSPMMAELPMLGPELDRIAGSLGARCAAVTARLNLTVLPPFATRDWPNAYMVGASVRRPVHR